MNPVNKTQLSTPRAIKENTANAFKAFFGRFEEKSGAIVALTNGLETYAMKCYSENTTNRAFRGSLLAAELLFQKLAKLYDAKGDYANAASAWLEVAGQRDRRKKPADFAYGMSDICSSKFHLAKGELLAAAKHMQAAFADFAAAGKTALAIEAGAGAIDLFEKAGNIRQILGFCKQVASFAEKELHYDTAAELYSKLALNSSFGSEERQLCLEASDRCSKKHMISNSLFVEMPMYGVSMRISGDGLG